MNPPDWFACTTCKVHGVRLWHDRMTKHFDKLACVDCMERVTSNEFVRYTPAVPLSGQPHTYAAYGEVSDEQATWWLALPLRKPSGSWWWLSFVNPQTRQFLGCTVVKAGSFEEAVAISHVNETNPGGECAGCEYDIKADPPTALRALVTSKGEANRLAEEWAAKDGL